MNLFWSEIDKKNGYQVYCAEPDEIPLPGVKRGASMWPHGKQDQIYATYDTYTLPQTDDPTIGWFYNWDYGYFKWSWNNDLKLNYDSYFLPMYAYPFCSEETDKIMGDGTCDDATCNENTCTHHKGNSKSETKMAEGFGEKYFAYFNEPYGEEQAGVTPEGARKKWDYFMAKVDEYAALNGYDRSEIKGGCCRSPLVPKIQKIQNSN